MDRVHGRNEGGAGGKSISEKTFTRQLGIVKFVIYGSRSHDGGPRLGYTQIRNVVRDGAG